MGVQQKHAESPAKALTHKLLPAPPGDVTAPVRCSECSMTVGRQMVAGEDLNLRLLDLSMSDNTRDKRVCRETYRGTNEGRGGTEEKEMPEKMGARGINKR